MSVIALILIGCDDESNLTYLATSFQQEPPTVTGLYLRDELGNDIGTLGYPSGVRAGYPNPFRHTISVPVSVPTYASITFWFVRAMGPGETKPSLTLPSGMADNTPWGIPLMRQVKYLPAGTHDIQFDFSSLPDGYYRMYLLFAGEIFFSDFLKTSDAEILGW